ncbi:hypothetical protein BH10PSE14_BH10PSE14_06780 [soil metagenome]
MTQTRDMKLGGRTFAVPPLPLGINMEVVYPLCRQLSLPGALVERMMATTLVEALTKEDLAVLADICFSCAQAADPTLTAKDFIDLNPTPPQMFDAFFTVARYQTGVWLPAPAAGEDESGEDQGEASPRKSISAESSPA